MQVTCLPQQDTDKDVSYICNEDKDFDDRPEMTVYEYFHSTQAYCANEAAEAFELY